MASQLSFIKIFRLSVTTSEKLLSPRNYFRFKNHPLRFWMNIYTFCLAKKVIFFCNFQLQEKILREGIIIRDMFPTPPLPPPVDFYSERVSTSPPNKKKFFLVVWPLRGGGGKPLKKIKTYVCLPLIMYNIYIFQASWSTNQGRGNPGLCTF